MSEHPTRVKTREDAETEVDAVERQPYPVHLYTDSDEDQKPRIAKNAEEELQALDMGYGRRTRPVRVASPVTLLAEVLSEMEAKPAIALVNRSSDRVQLDEARKAETRLAVQKAIDARLEALDNPAA